MGGATIWEETIQGENMQVATMWGEIMQGGVLVHLPLHHVSN